MFKIKNNNKESGLTMIELIVSIGIFSLIVVMAVGTFILALSSQRRIIALRNVEDNTRFTIEVIAREIRTGVNFSGGGSTLSFTNAAGQSVVYRLNSNAIEKSINGGSTYSAVTGSEITVNYLSFYLTGQALGDGLQPRITVVIGVTGQVGNQTANLKIQTTISERLLQS